MSSVFYSLKQYFQKLYIGISNVCYTGKPASTDNVYV